VATVVGRLEMIDLNIVGINNGIEVAEQLIYCGLTNADCNWKVLKFESCEAILRYLQEGSDRRRW